MEDMDHHLKTIEDAIEKNKQVKVLQSTSGYKQIRDFLVQKSEQYLNNLASSSDLQEIYRNQGAHDALTTVVQALDKIPEELEYLTKELELITAEMAENKKYGIAV
jgi:uncharacterized protein (DUF2164 family)